MIGADGYVRIFLTCSIKACDEQFWAVRTQSKPQDMNTKGRRNRRFNFTLILREGCDAFPLMYVTGCDFDAQKRKASLETGLYLAWCGIIDSDPDMKGGTIVRTIIALLCIKGLKLSD